tara:strand:+ start:219 stop:1502 length:1284 start_codon:yes stop_codon:yes gene_type:complete
MSALAQLVTNPQWPYLRIIYVHLWPTIMPLAAVCNDARTAGKDLAREVMSAALGDSVAGALQASWLLVQSAFARQLVFSIGGSRRPALAHVAFADRFNFDGIGEDAFDEASFRRCADMPQQRCAEHSAAFCGGFLYVTNDCDHASWHKEHAGPGDDEHTMVAFARYHLIRDEWQPCAALPLQSVPDGFDHPTGGALTEHAGRLYYSGGSSSRDIFNEDGDVFDFENRVLDTVYVLDTDANTWHLHSRMTTGRTHHGMTSYAGSLWVFGGQERNADVLHPVAEVLGNNGQWRTFGSSLGSVMETLDSEDPSDLKGCKLAVVNDQLCAWADSSTALFLYDKEEDTFQFVGDVGPGGRGGIASIGGDRILCLAGRAMGCFWMDPGGNIEVSTAQNGGAGWSNSRLAQTVLQDWVEVEATPLVRAPIAFHE